MNYDELLATEINALDDSIRNQRFRSSIERRAREEAAQIKSGILICLAKMAAEKETI